jgi:hypothetical protein
VIWAMLGFVWVNGCGSSCSGMSSPWKINYIDIMNA